MATYYIAPQSGSDANPGTEALPRLTPPAAANGDVWYFKRGETYTRAIQLSLGAATGMTLDAYGTGDMPIITIAATANTFALNIQGDGTHFIRNLWFRNCQTNTNGGVIGLGIVSGPGYAASAEITGCRFTGCNWNAIRGGGTSTATASLRIVVQDCEFDDIGEDCIYGPALYMEIGRNRMTNISSRTTTGDGVGFLGADPTLVWVYQNTIDHSSVDSRHCVIVDATTPGAGLAIIEDNTFIGFGSATNAGVDHTVVNTDCRAIIRRNRIVSGQIAINAAGASSEIVGNVIEVRNVRTGADTVVALQANSVRVANNTFVGRAGLLSTAKAVTQAAGASSGVVQNNIFVDIPIAIKSDNGANNPTSTNNNFFGVTSQRLDASNNAFSGGSDVTGDPQLRSDYMPLSTAVRSAGTYLGGLDFYGKEFQSPPTIGAVQYQPARSVTTRTVESRTVTTRSVASRRGVTA